MKDVNILKRYIEDFTLLLKGIIRPNIYTRVLLFPISTQGGVFEIHLEENGKTSIEIQNEFIDISSCLNTLKQNMIGPNFKGNIHFGGTNFFLENNRVILIKGEDDKWSNDDVVNDYKRFHSALTGRKK